MIEMYLFNIKVFIYTKSKWLKKKKRNNCNNVNQYFSSLPHPPSGRIFLVHSFISVLKIDSYEKKPRTTKHNSL